MKLSELLLLHENIKPFTSDEIQRIEKADHKKFTSSYVVDWGSGRGQGKRIKGQILGAMSDMRGKKTYVDLFAKFPKDDPTHDRQEQAWFINRPLFTLTYLKARAAGFNHDRSVDYAVLKYPD